MIYSIGICPFSRIENGPVFHRGRVSARIDKNLNFTRTHIEIAFIILKRIMSINEMINGN
jgi:hypothetical protein